MQILKRTLAAAAALTFAVGAAAQAQAPDFTGQWELNASKSDFGPMASQAPTKIAMTVSQTATSVKVVQAMSTPQGDLNSTSEYTLDGKPATTTGVDGAPVVNTAKVDGSALAIQTKMSREGMDITRNSRWTLGADGKTLMVEQNLATPMGAMTMKIVFDKK